jgi:hypothetical protein
MKRLLVAPLVFMVALAGAATGIVQDLCGPFTDVSPTICPYVLEMYYLGIAAGTSPTTYSPDNPVTRGQAAVFVSKGVNQAIARSSSRAALGQWWLTTPHWDIGLGTTAVGNFPTQCACDGQDVWVANEDFGGPGSVSRVRGSDGKLLETWTSATGAFGILSAMGRIFVAGISASKLYMIDPSQPAGDVTIVADLGLTPSAMAFDGVRIWTANNLHSVSMITPGTWAVTTVEGFQAPVGAVFDGMSVWITDFTAGTLLRLNSDGSVAQTVTVGGSPEFPVFDGENIWVPNYNDNTISVVRASTGAVVATLSGNGLSGPEYSAFDGRRVLVTSRFADTISLWNAADLSPIGTRSTGAGSHPLGACSDGIGFWIPLSASNTLGRF